jgi:DNA-binding MarR family transcriptional regulator
MPKRAKKEAPVKDVAGHFPLAEEYASRYDFAEADAIEVHQRLLATAEAVERAASRLVASFGSDKTRGRYGVMRVLYFAPEGRMSQNEIGQHMNTTPASVTYLVDSLERDNLVARRPHPTDRRVTWVELTPAGIEVCEELVPAMARHMTNLSAGFTPRERLQLNKLLAKLRAAALLMARD